MRSTLITTLVMSFHVLTFSGSAAAQSPPANAVVFDTFTGTNGTLLSAHAPDLGAPNAWTTWGGVSVKLDNGRVGPAGQDGSSYTDCAVIESGTSNGIVGIDWTPGTTAQQTGSNPIAGVLFRYTDVSNYWLASRGSDAKFHLTKYVAGTATAAATSASDGTLASGTHHLEVHLSASAIELWFDGVLRLQATDTFNVSATKHGLYWMSAYDWGSRFDNFAVQQPVIDHLMLAPSTL